MMTFILFINIKEFRIGERNTMEDLCSFSRVPFDRRLLGRREVC